MADQSNIEWTDMTWNSVTGCNKVSPGCKLCYAERMSKRLQGMGSPKYRNAFEVTLHPDTLKKPIELTRPRHIFVNSMSDTFHEKVPSSYILEIFKVMNEAHWHQFQVLTKRPERAVEIQHELHWSPNIWMGTSVELAEYQCRIDLLRETGAHIKFLSLEPLLGALPDLNLEGIDWVIVGGESGPRARTMKADWVREIRDQCHDAKVAFFFKQWGGPFKKQTGRMLDGQVLE